VFPIQKALHHLSRYCTLVRLFPAPMFRPGETHKQMLPRPYTAIHQNLLVIHSEFRVRLPILQITSLFIFRVWNTKSWVYFFLLSCSRCMTAQQLTDLTSLLQNRCKTCDRFHILFPLKIRQELRFFAIPQSSCRRFIIR